MENKVIDPITGSTLLKLQPLNEDIGTYKSRSIQTVSTGPYLDAVIKQLPILASGAQLGNAYKIVYPPGIAGELVKHVNSPHLKGLYMSSVRGVDGKFVGQAGLQSLSFLQAPIIAFVVMSVLTGQYFQAKTEKALRRISQQLDQIIQMILAEKESDIRSIYHFTNYVIQNLETIQNHDELRQSTLTNVQRNNITIYSLMKFYEKNIDVELSNMDKTAKELKANPRFSKNALLTGVLEEILNISNYLERRQMCIDIYIMGRVLEIQLCFLFSDSYLNNLKSSLNQINNANVPLMHRIIDVYKDISSIPAVKSDKNISLGKLPTDIRKLDERKISTTNTINNINESLDGILKFNKKGFECVYIDNELLLLEI